MRTLEPIVVLLACAGWTWPAAAAPLEVRVPATDSSVEPWLEGVEMAQEIVLTTHRGGRLSDQRATELGRALEGRALRTLRLHRFSADAASLQLLLGADGLSRVSALEVSESELDEAAFRTLGEGAYRGLRFLKLDRTGLGMVHLVALANGGSLSNVEWLSLEGNRLGADAVRALAQAPGLSRLRRLRLNQNPVGADGARALATARFSQLAVLELRNASLDDAALEALVTGPLAAHLTRLDLRENAALSRDGVAAVASGNGVALSEPPELEATLRSAWDAALLRANGVGEKLSRDLVIAAPEDLDALQGVRRIEGTLALTDDVSSLQALLNLEEIRGSLVIRDTTALRDLRGLESLKHIGGDLRLLNNTALSSLRGAGALEEIGGSLRIENCPRLKRARGLDSLARIGGDVQICYPRRRARLARRVAKGFRSVEVAGEARAECGAP